MPALTPERLQQIRRYAAAADPERTSWDPDDLIDLVDEIQRLHDHHSCGCV